MTFSPLMLEDGKCAVCRMPQVSWNVGGELRRKRFVEMIVCACGCGTTFNKYDDRNRPRTFVDKTHRNSWRKWKVAAEIREIQLDPRRADT